MENPDEVNNLKVKIARLEKINLALMDRVEKSISKDKGAFSVFQKNSLLSLEIEKKTAMLNASIKQVAKQNRAINGILLISEVDISGNIIYVNEKFCQASGYKKDEILGKNHRILSSSHHSPRFWNQFWATLKKGNIFRGEICNKNKTGELFWIDITVYPNFDTDGNLYGFTAVSLDITEKKLSEIKNQHVEKLASIGELAAGVGHEINNPLTISIANLNKLKKDLLAGGQDPKDISRCLEKIIAANERIKVIVHGLTVLSRSDKEVLEDVSLNKFVFQTVDFVKEVYANEGVSIQIEIPETYDFFVLANSGKFHQIIVNLLSNAKDATEKTPDRLIKVRLFEREPNEVVLAITDNGSGIPSDLISKIVEPFFTTKDVGKGTGLGLGIVNSFVKQFNGKLEIESEIDVGSTFTVVLPIVRKHQNK